MASLRIVKSAMGAVRIVSTRMASGTSMSHMANQRTAGVDLANFDPNNYKVPIRPVTMDDMMEPYGSWKVAYEKEKRLANAAIFKGVVCLTASILFLLFSGATEGLDMPNLDNIMEDTEPFNFDTEGRITVVKDDD